MPTSAAVRPRERPRHLCVNRNNTWRRSEKSLPRSSVALLLIGVTVLRKCSLPLRQRRDRRARLCLIYRPAPDRIQDWRRRSASGRGRSCALAIARCEDRRVLRGRRPEQARRSATGPHSCSKRRQRHEKVRRVNPGSGTGQGSSWHLLGPATRQEPGSIPAHDDLADPIDAGWRGNDSPEGLHDGHASVSRKAGEREYSRAGPRSVLFT